MRKNIGDGGGKLEPGVALALIMKRVQRYTHIHWETAFGKDDLNLTQWITLSLISSRDAISLSHIARELDHDSGAMSRVIDVLARRGLVHRHPDQTDRRFTRLAMTASGRDVLDRVTSQGVDIWNSWLEVFSKEEINAFLNMLQRLENNLVAMNSKSAVGPSL